MKEIINALQRIRRNYLAEFLRNEKWVGSHVRFAKPYVNRIRFIFGDYRVCLHEILPCEPDEPMWHSHPWETAFLLLRGTQEIGLGWDKLRYFHGQGYTLQPKSSAGKNSPKIKLQKVLTPGHIYQMDAIADWHYVRPMKDKTYSIMLNGPQVEVRERPEGFGERMSEAEVNRYKELWLSVLEKENQ